MSEKTNTQTPERPDVSPEQLRAFRTAYAQLMKKATERNEKQMAIVDPETSEITSHLSEGLAVQENKVFQPNSIGGTVFIDEDDADVYCWIYAHDEALTAETGIVGSFTITTNEGGDEQDIYEFYKDGNIEKIHYTMAGQPHSSIPEDINEHVSWLNTEETEQLTFVMEGSNI